MTAREGPATKKDIESAKLELASEMHDLRKEMTGGFEAVEAYISELRDLLKPTARALDATLIDVRALKRRVSRLEKQTGIAD